MSKFAYLSPALAVAGALSREDFAEIARLGFKTIINNRPDGEEPGQLTAREEAVLAWRSGLAYRHVPAVKHEVLEEAVLEPLVEALGSVPGPVLLHCRSGLRSTIMWAAISIDAGAPVEEILAAAKAAGHDLSGIAEDITDRAAAMKSADAQLAPSAEKRAAA